MSASRTSRAKRGREELEKSESDTNKDGVQHFLTFVQGGSDKFYEISIAGSNVLSRYGRTGSAGVTTVKSFASDEGKGEAMRAHISKLLRDKTKKGYVEQPLIATPPSKKKKDSTPSNTEEVDEADKNNKAIISRNDGDLLISPDPLAVEMLLTGKGKGKGKETNDSSRVRVVCSTSGEPYAALLCMQQAEGVEKFYNIQLLHLDRESSGSGSGSGGSFQVFCRWGNARDEGYTELLPATPVLSSAVQDFEKRFKIKTGNHWRDRGSFAPRSFHFRLGRAGHSAAAPKDDPVSAKTITVSAAPITAETAREASVVRLVYLECRIGSADKFYSLEQTSEHQVTIRYGRRLTAGVMSEKQFTSAAEADAFVSKTAAEKERKGYCHVEREGDEGDEGDEGESGGGAGVGAVEPQSGGGAEASGDPAVDLENGLKVFVQGNSKLPYTLKKFMTGSGYSCTCRGWVGQIRIKGIQAASCKHLKQVRGEAAEATRCQTSAGAVANPSSKGNKNSSIVQKVSLAQKWKPSIDPSGYLMSEKLDGMRAYWCGKKLWTRSGLPVIAPEWFTADLPSTVELDGELFLGRKLFDECMSITRRTDASEDWKRIRFVVFDAPKASGGIASRLEVASASLAACSNDYAVVHPHTVCQGAEHLLSELASMERAGGEGMMLRSATAPHRGGRTVDLLKVKSFHDDEAIVTDYEEGRGKYSGMVGSLVCRSRGGAAFKVGSGLVDSQRSYNSQALPRVGAVITFQYFELTKDGIPRFPTYLRLRPDVDPAEFS